MAKTTKKVEPTVEEVKLVKLQEECLKLIKSNIFKYDVPGKFTLAQEAVIKNFTKTLMESITDDPKEKLEEIKKQDFLLAKSINELLKIKVR